MKLTMFDIKACERGILRLMNATLPVESSFKLLGILGTIRQSLSKLEESRINLVKKYGVKDEETGAFNVPQGTDGWKEFEKDLSVIMSEEIEFKGFEPINVGALGNTQISAVELEPLMGKFLTAEPMIKEEEAPKRPEKTDVSPEE